MLDVDHEPVPRFPVRGFVTPRTFRSFASFFRPSPVAYRSKSSRTIAASAELISYSTCVRRAPSRFSTFV
ncbi:MAG TPA: hypothetical protein VH062_09890 [Polyangiaceae bacterium]|nr:hypothetical protein [Polyangiaceae bacterium]